MVAADNVCTCPAPTVPSCGNSVRIFLRSPLSLSQRLGGTPHPTAAARAPTARAVSPCHPRGPGMKHLSEELRKQSPLFLPGWPEGKLENPRAAGGCHCRRGAAREQRKRGVERQRERERQREERETAKATLSEPLSATTTPGLFRTRRLSIIFIVSSSSL